VFEAFTQLLGDPVSQTLRCDFTRLHAVNFFCFTSHQELCQDELGHLSRFARTGVAYYQAECVLAIKHFSQNLRFHHVGWEVLRVLFELHIGEVHGPLFIIKIGEFG
jgi:hypothetical protein